MLLDQFASLGAVGLHVGAIAWQGLENFGRQAPKPGGRRLHRPADVPLALGENIDEAFAIDRQLHCPANFRVAEGWRLTIDEQVYCDRRLRQLADRVGRLAFDVAHRLHRDLVGKGHVELAGDKGERLGRAVRDDGPLDTVEIGPARLPVIRVLRKSYVIVRLELDEFEWARADRMRAHVARGHVARVNR